MAKKAAKVAARAQVQAEKKSQMVAKAAAKAAAKKESTEEARVKAEEKAQIKLRSKPETKRAKAAKGKSFACDVDDCDKVYSSKNALARHMVAHTGVRGHTWSMGQMFSVFCVPLQTCAPPTRATTYASKHVHTPLPASAPSRSLGTIFMRATPFFTALLYEIPPRLTLYMFVFFSSPLLPPPSPPRPPPSHFTPFCSFLGSTVRVHSLQKGFRVQARPQTTHEGAQG